MGYEEINVRNLKSHTGKPKLTYVMVGGGNDAFIGYVHRIVAEMDRMAELVGGCFSSTPEKSRESGLNLALPEDRIYGSVDELVEKESNRKDRADFAIVVTPTNVHFDPVMKLVNAGFNVACDKPMTAGNVEQAMQIYDAVNKSGSRFMVTHNYTGAAVIKQARAMIQSGEFGPVTGFDMPYIQGWLNTAIEREGQKQAVARTDPRYTGNSCGVADIGTHAENMLRYISGQELAEVMPFIWTKVPGRMVEDNATIMVKLTNGAYGNIRVSQTTVGAENRFWAEIRTENATFRWDQENLNYLVVNHGNKPSETYTRGGPGLCDAAKATVRIPSGHSEGYLESFATLYRAFEEAIIADVLGLNPALLKRDYPTVVTAGVKGVQFIDLAVNGPRTVWTPNKYLAANAQLVDRQDANIRSA